jgi:hypothetical protein
LALVRDKVAANTRIVLDRATSELTNPPAIGDALARQRIRAAAT